MDRKQGRTWVHRATVGSSWSKAPAPSPSRAAAAAFPCRSPAWLRVEKAAAKFPGQAALAQVKVAQEAGEPEKQLIFCCFYNFKPVGPGGPESPHDRTC